MLRSILVALTMASAAFADPPTKQKEAEALWLWQQVECKGGVCAVVDKTKWQAQALFLWQQKDCQCGPDCGCDNGANCKCSQSECYGRLRAKAIAEHKILLVAVGCEPRRVEGFFACRYDAFPGVKKGIVVGLPEGKELLQGPVLDPKATESAIKAATKPRAQPLSGPT